jgi:hypothetical protein
VVHVRPPRLFLLPHTFHVRVICGEKRACAPEAPSKPQDQSLEETGPHQGVVDTALRRGSDRPTRSAWSGKHPLMFGGLAGRPVVPRRLVSMIPLSRTVCTAKAELHSSRLRSVKSSRS